MKYSYDSRTGFARLIQTAVNVLKKIQPLIAGGECEIVTGGALAALLSAKRRIGQNNVIALHFFATVGQSIT